MKTSILLAVLIIWLIVPTGTPDDVLTFTIIAALGIEVYLIILLIILILLWQYNIGFKKMNGMVKESHKELKRRMRRKKK